MFVALLDHGNKGGFVVDIEHVDQQHAAVERDFAPGGAGREAHDHGQHRKPVRVAHFERHVQVAETLITASDRLSFDKELQFAREEVSDLLIITKEGKIIRLEAGEIRQAGRSTQGVRLVRMEEGDQVAAASVIPETEAENGSTPEGQSSLLQ